MSGSLLQDLRVLVVDGDRRRGEALRRMLSDIGAVGAILAETAEAALSALSGRRFDLVAGHMDDSVVDMEGSARALRADTSSLSRETPILLITATPDRSELLSALDAGVTGFLAGALTPERLRGQILSLLQSYGPL